MSDPPIPARLLTALQDRYAIRSELGSGTWPSRSCGRTRRNHHDRNYTVVPGEERFIFLRPPETMELVVVTDWYDRVRALFGIEK